MSLTAEQREIIRRAIHERQLKMYLHDQHGIKRCIQCNTEASNYTAGCKACVDRRRRRNRLDSNSTRAKCSHCGRRTRSRHGICTPCQEATAFVASRQAA